MQMQISSMSSTFNIKPSAPTAPTPPPGGNIENRQPPSEPSAPNNSGDTQSTQNTDPLSQFVKSIDEEYGTNIKASLEGLSEDGRSVLKTKLDSFKTEADGLSMEDRAKGFLKIMTDVFKEFGGDYQSTGNLLSAYA